MDERYEAIELDGKWFVFDHHHPEFAPAERIDARDAEVSARLWNLITSSHSF